MAVEEELTRALRDNDADGISRCLSDDWAVISARGGVGEGKSIFPEGIKSGFLKQRHMGIGTQSAPLRKYRLGDNEAAQRSHVWGQTLRCAGAPDRWWLWKDGGWKCVLTHDAWEGAEKDQKELSR